MVAGTPLLIRDAPGSIAAQWIASELSCDEYRLDRIGFAADDVVLDVGAHVGLVAIWLALRNPGIRIVALEPDPLNFAHLTANIAANAVRNVVPLELAVTADARPLEIARPPDNSGGASACFARSEGFATATVKSTKLDVIFTEYVENRCKLLKMDCEGAEHEILPACTILPRVDWFSAEFHINSQLQAKGCSNEGLAELVRGYVLPERISIKSINMGE